MRCKQAPPVIVSRSGESQRESNWEHAEVAKKKKEGRQGTGKEVQDRGKRERERERERERKKTGNASTSGSQNLSVGQNMSVRFSVGFPQEKGVLSI